MRIETIEKLCCPFDKAELSLTVIHQDDSGNVTEGFLICSECKRLYPIITGIPIMNPDEYREFKFEQPVLDKWQSHLSGKTIENFRVVDPEDGNQLLQ
ncbi:Trm112 family protein [Parapedobacter pyrenivorans]|uniref:Trm112 family protein n=1 Tax=Parapedobacter pyrenivorans TaxID=1305674 RepID=UPI00333E2419